jgi:2-phosphosulfolactate phosphatase
VGEDAHPDWVLQGDYTVRCEWGPNAVEALAPRCAVVVVVDVLSFSTAVEIATARGARVFPYRFRDPSALEFAREHDALLAGQNPQGYSLKPASLVEIEPGCRLMLPSPNGSTLSLGTGRARTLAGCLRNRRAVAAEAARGAGPQATIGVVPAGERWKSDGSLRPAWEDACGAGAIIDALPRSLSRSPEAEAAARLFRASRDDLSSMLADCASGREKHAGGDAADVALAGDLDASDNVPVLEDGAYCSSRSTRSG